MNKKHIQHIPARSNIKGFSIIEFMVASLLSMIVLIAVSGGYFTTLQLNKAGMQRLSVQQDLRNAANQIVRDARMAGSFGCFNISAAAADGSRKFTATAVTEENIANEKDAFKLLGGAGKDQLNPVKEITSGLPSGLTKAIAFQYGTDPVSGTGDIFSSCGKLYRPNGSKTDAEIKTALGATQDNEITRMSYAVNAYAVGTVDGKTGLFRVQRSGNGWGNPQLLVDGPSSVDFEYIYPNDCAAGTFKLESSLRADTTPAMVRLRLNNGTAINAGDAADTNNITVYNIDATVRGGNTCADRTV
ncbi:PilW family protein [Neisseria sp.]|uniref:PilW family protein n=1 Tax=Neisseria sp. TaxID=192066 RepID=UPI0035A08564